MRTFHQLKEALEQHLKQLSALPDIKAATIQGLLDKLRQNRFHLLVLGAFKRGKSTLINALLGEALLPVAIIPLTSVVTILGYGERLSIQVLFRDGQRRLISKEELVDYITEKGNPQNHKGVQEVEITYPSEYLQDGVRLIDTPGWARFTATIPKSPITFFPRWTPRCLWSRWTRPCPPRNRNS
ncbi:MAG: dynamin family protein [Desulfobaccales bacterium]